MQTLYLGFPADQKHIRTRLIGLNKIIDDFFPGNPRIEINKFETASINTGAFRAYEWLPLGVHYYPYLSLLKLMATQTIGIHALIHDEGQFYKEKWGNLLEIYQKAVTTPLKQEIAKLERVAHGIN